MGNQPSKGEKDSKGGKSPSSDNLSIDRDSYASFGRSDTKESNKSIRNQLRSKIPSSGKPEPSPRASLNSVADNSGSESALGALAALEDADRAKRKGGASSASVRSASRSSQKDRRSSEPAPKPISKPESIDIPDRKTALSESPQPPPSPTQSASLGQGHNVENAQRSGEVDHVSDAPPSGAASAHTHTQKAGESILMKKGDPIPRVPDVAATTDGNNSPMELNALKQIDLDDMISRLLDAAYGGKVTKTVCLKNAEIFAVCQAARELFLSQPALLELSPPVKIVGDIHGQYTDLIRMFEMCGFPPTANYLFLGDYVDRGKQSLETILLLMCYKLKFPENFFLLRGNHECANVTRVYGFYDECKRRTNVKVWKAFVDTFNTLPIAAIVAGKIFCVHGGLSPSLSHMDDIRQIARPTDVPDYGLLNDLLWSDPADMENDWESNERGVSYCFGKKVIMEFLQRHDFDLVCRAHMVVEDGYEFFNDRILVTVFSAPNVSPATLDN